LTKEQVKRKTKKIAIPDAAKAVERPVDDHTNSARPDGERTSPTAPGGSERPRRVASGLNHSEAMKKYRHEVKMGVRTRTEKSYPIPPDPNQNPLLLLPDEDCARLFSRMRDCPYPGAVRDMLVEKNLSHVTTDQINEFHQAEAYYHWDFRAGRAAVEADALVSFVERERPQFTAAILAGLGQETFRLLSRDEIDAPTLTRLANLFMKARSDDRADQMQGLKRRVIEGELQGQLEQAFAKFAEEVQNNPGASVALEALRRELAGTGEGAQ
jgi:hypothetical protein